MKGKRTPEWWLTRFLLGVGIAPIVLIVLSIPRLLEPHFGGRDWVTIGPLELPADVAIATVALATAIVGLIWMVRILRGPRDEPLS